MSGWRAVSKKNHLKACWAKFSDYRFTAEDMICPLVAAELPHVVGYFPLGFVQNDGRYDLVALQSLQPGLNLFVNAQGQWLAPYVPSYYRSYPFRLLRSEGGASVLCVDESSKLFHSAQTGPGQAFFDAAGEYSKAFSEVVEFLQQRHNSQALTQSLVDQLAAVNLIEPWPIERKNDNGIEATQVHGLYRINEGALQTLLPDQLSSLAQSGALAMAYAQLLSQYRLNDFESRHQAYIQDLARQSTDEINLDSLFGEQVDTIKFGF